MKTFLLLLVAGLTVLPAHADTTPAKAKKKVTRPATKVVKKVVPPVAPAPPGELHMELKAGDENTQLTPPPATSHTLTVPTTHGTGFQPTGVEGSLGPGGTERYLPSGPPGILGPSRSGGPTPGMQF